MLSIGVIYIQFIITGLLLWFIPELGEGYRQRFGYGYQYYNFAMFIGLIAIIFTYIGYMITMKKPSFKNYFWKYDIFIMKHKNIIFKIAVLFSILSIMIFLYKQSIGLLHFGGILTPSEKQYNTTNNILGIIDKIFNIGYILSIYLAFIFDKYKWKIIIIMIFIFKFTIAASNGGAIGVFGTIIPFLILYLYNTRIPFFKKIKKINLYRIVPLIILFISILFVIKNIVRTFAKLGFQANFFDIINNIDLIVEHIDLKGALLLALTNFIQEISSVDLISLISYQIDHEINELRYGYTYLLIFVSFIPSLIWNSKPEISQTIWFADNYFRDPEEVARIGSGLQGNNFYLTGEAVMNFGIYAVPLEMLFFGVLLGLISKFFLPYKQLLFVNFIILSNLFYDSIHPATTLAALVSGYIKNFLISIVGIRIIMFIVKIIIGVKRI